MRPGLDLAKMLRVRAMLEAMRDEFREHSPDAQSLQRLAAIHNEIESQLGSAVSAKLESELIEFSSCCRDNPDPSESEIRVAQAQVVGWIEGVLRGIQFSLTAEEATAAVEDEVQPESGDDAIGYL